MPYRGGNGFARYIARHLSRGSNGGGGFIAAFIITFILLSIFTHNIFIAGFFLLLYLLFFNFWRVIHYLYF